jgi:hypothetical protein
MRGKGSRGVNPVLAPPHLRKGEFGSDALMKKNAKNKPALLILTYLTKFFQWRIQRLPMPKK